MHSTCRTVQWCASTRDPPDKSSGALVAVDASTGKIIWRYDSARPMLAAVTATSAGVVFAGELTGDFLALDAKTGKVLYRFDMGGPMVGGIAAYQAGGAE